LENCNVADLIKKTIVVTLTVLVTLAVVGGAVKLTATTDRHLLASAPPDRSGQVLPCHPCRVA
jgi:hypothetical protein